MIDEAWARFGLQMLIIGIIAWVAKILTDPEEV